MDTLEFQNAAPDPTVFVEEFWNNVDGTNILSPWNNEGVPYSYSYPGDSPSATASISGEQLGDLGWPLIIFSKEALEDLIATAEQLIAANQVGNNIGNFAQFAVDSLQRAIDASQIVVDDPAATAEEIENAINTLNDAIDFFFSRLITGTSPKSGKSILVYPNPSSSFFRIQSESELKAVNLITLEGKEIHTWHSPLPDQDYGITRLSTGVYLIQLKLKDGTLQTIRMVKK
ncbi:MAG: T9SS type A sorting domain-containing protein [Bacteroidota bacterium]